MGIVVVSTPAEALAEAPADGPGDAVGMVTGAVGVVDAESDAAAAAACAAISACSPEAFALRSPPEAIAGVLRRGLEPAPPIVLAGMSLVKFLSFSPFSARRAFLEWIAWGLDAGGRGREERSKCFSGIYRGSAPRSFQRLI